MRVFKVLEDLEIQGKVDEDGKAEILSIPAGAILPVSNEGEITYCVKYVLEIDARDQNKMTEEDMKETDYVQFLISDRNGNNNNYENALNNNASTISGNALNNASTIVGNAVELSNNERKRRARRSTRRSKRRSTRRSSRRN